VNCRALVKALASGKPLRRDGLDHLRQCPHCAALANLGATVETRAASPDSERRIIGAIVAGLAPVKPLAPAWHYVLATLGLLALVAAAGILMWGNAGWLADSLVKKAYFTACLGLGILFSAVLVAQLMTPGAYLPLPPSRLIALAVACTAGGALLYPVSYYEGFAHAAAACNAIGLGYGAVACAVSFLLARRGVSFHRAKIVTICALGGALTGVVILFVFCPHRDLGHFLLGHAPVAPVAVAIAAGIGRMLSADPK
jgi:hypothetical protein